MPFLLIHIHQPDCNHCERCRTIDKAGYMLEDPTGSRKFFCISCLVSLLRADVTPRTVGVES